MLSLRGEIRDDILTHKKQEAAAQQRDQLIEILVGECKDLMVPKSMKETQQEFLKNRIENQMKRDGVEKLPEFTEDDKKYIEARAEFQSKATLILSKISQKESLQVNEAEVGGRVRMLADQLKQPLDQVQKKLNDSGMIQRIRDEVLTDQVFDWLLKQSNIVETESPAPKK